MASTIVSPKLKALKYRVGTPGMIADTSYKHTRQMMQDNYWVNKTADKDFPYGTAAFYDPAKHEICLADVANAVFLGIFQDPGLFMGNGIAYKPQEPVIIMTMGDIWASIDPTIDINFMDKVYIVKAAGNKLGWVTNVAAGNTVVLGARFLTDNANGVVTVGLGVTHDPTPAP